MKAISLNIKQANAFVEALHRHYKSVHGDKFRIGCEVEGKLVCVLQKGR